MSLAGENRVGDFLVQLRALILSGDVGALSDILDTAKTVDEEVVVSKADIERGVALARAAAWE